MWELLTSGRLGRLALKELRETLRDRRTLFTLVLMPLLVYPLLSMALQRFIFTYSPTSTDPTILIGVSDDREMEFIEQTIQLAKQLVDSKSYRPFQRGREGEKREGETASSPVWKGVLIESGIEGSLERGEVDISLSIDRDEAEAGSSRGIESLSPDDGIRQAWQPRTFQLRYRQRDSRSEASYRAFRELLETVNDHHASVLRQAHGLGKRAPMELVAIPLEQSGGLLESVASLLPLVLLLMTITGAVYPAIDLTAGERERGTMEAVLATPIPRLGLLLSKFVAVLTVSLLTAVVNLGAMMTTLHVGGLGQALLGEEGFSLTSLFLIFPILVLFASFFSAVLLALCSLAKSFKEAQAYLIPIMLFSLGPGVLSLIPGVKLSPLLAVVPILNMMLLARDVLTATVDPLLASLVCVSTLFYALAMMAVAAHVFSRQTMAQELSFTLNGWWRPATLRNRSPSIAFLLVYLACFFPLYFVATNLSGRSVESTLGERLTLNAVLTASLFLVLPLAVAMWRGLALKSTFLLTRGVLNGLNALPIIFLSLTLWVVAHEIFLISEWLGLATLRPEQVAAAAKVKSDLAALPLAFVWITMAVVPAIAEEFFFRGLVLKSLASGQSVRSAILWSAALFGAFHVVSGSILAIERFFPTFFLGIILGWLACRYQSLWPGCIVHAIHNGLLFTVAKYEDWLKSAGWGMEEQRHLPIAWIATGIATVVIAVIAIRVVTPKPQEEASVRLPDPESTSKAP